MRPPYPQIRKVEAPSTPPLRDALWQHGLTLRAKTPNKGADLFKPPCYTTQNK